MTRRNLLQKFYYVGALFLFNGFWKLSQLWESGLPEDKSSPYRFHLTFMPSESFDLEQLKAHRPGYLNENKFYSINEIFKQQGRLLHSSFNKDANGQFCWSYVFKSKADQQFWERAGHHALLSSYKNKNIHYRINWDYVDPTDYNHVVRADKEMWIS